MPVHQVGPPHSAATLLGVDTFNMDKAHKQALEEVVLEFAEIFSTRKQDLGCTDKIPLCHQCTGSRKPLFDYSKKSNIHSTDGIFIGT